MGNHHERHSLRAGNVRRGELSSVGTDLANALGALALVPGTAVSYGLRRPTVSA